jgi:hypothetical protein
LQAQLVERVGHQGLAVAEDVDVDVGPFADVPGADAADQPGAEARQEPHHAEGVEPHVAEVFQPLGPLVNARQRLNLVADLLVARQIARSVAILDPELLGRLALGGEILGLGPQVHHLGGQKSELAPDAFVGHDGEVRRFSAHRCGAGQGRQAGRMSRPARVP